MLHKFSFLDSHTEIKTGLSLPYYTLCNGVSNSPIYQISQFFLTVFFGNIIHNKGII